MLQIISGKFFTSADLLKHDGLAVVYSNIRSFAPIETCIATIAPAGNSGAFVIKYTNQIERDDERRQARLIRVGDPEIVDQFLLLSTFGLQAFFSLDPNEVTLNCRTTAVNDGDNILPSRFIPRYFEPEVYAKSEAVCRFRAFVAKVISLPREKYELTLRYLSALRDALDAINYNFDLSYSMIVYAMEALSQSGSTFIPVWDDYDPTMRSRLSKSFGKMDAAVVEEVKKNAA